MATKAALLDEILEILKHPRTTLDVIHDWGCHATVIGKKAGPCNCPAGPQQKRVDAFIQKLEPR